MKSNLLKLFAFGLTLTAFTACNKDDNDSPPKTKTEILSQAAWKFDAEGIDMNKDGTIDMPTGLVEACSKDDIVTFKTNGTGTVDEGASKCDVDDPQSWSFDWAFKNGEAEIEYDGDTYKIEELSDTKLKIYFEGEIQPGSTVRVYAIFKH